MTVGSTSNEFTVRTIASADDAAVASLLDRATRRNPPLERRVARIVEDVRRDGDRALLAYAKQFDNLAGPMEVSREEMRRGAHPKDAGMAALKRIKANTIEKRLLNSRGEPNFNINFYVLSAKGEYAGVTMYNTGKLSFAVCDEKGPRLERMEPLLQGAPE